VISLGLGAPDDAIPDVHPSGDPCGCLPYRLRLRVESNRGEHSRPHVRRRRPQYGGSRQDVEPVTFEVENPCNGELIIFSGTAETQVTFVDTREHLDAGFSLHTELQQRTTATGTGSETGATYTINDIFHEGFESPNPTAPHATFSAHATTRVTSDIAGLSFTGHFVFQGVVPSGRDFKVTASLDRLRCS
jgi:hypothetical protein